MARWFNFDLKTVCNENTLRFDFLFKRFNEGLKYNAYYQFSDLFCFSEEQSVESGAYEEGDFYYAEIGDTNSNGEVSPTLLSFDQRNDENENYFKKIEKGDIIAVKKDDILISKVRPNLKKYIFIDQDNEDIFFTSAFIHLRPKIIPKLLYYSLKTIFYRNLIAISRQGKGYPTLSEQDFYSLKFERNIIDNLIKNERVLLKQIIPIEEKIKSLKRQIIDEKLIINEVFAREFGFDIKTFEKLKEEKSFCRNFFNFSQNLDLRFSAKFHRAAAKFVYDELAKITDKKLKDFISEPIVLGSSISPEDFDEMGEQCFISMADIKTWKIDVGSCKTISKPYFQSNQNKLVTKGDLIVARSGEGTIGKIAMIENHDFEGVFADFTMRIRLKSYSNLFAYFYFRTEYFQYLIEVHKKGLGNNTNIFPVQIREFPMPNIPLERQERIADEIKQKIEGQDAIGERIKLCRQKIEEIMSNVIAN